ncbi:MAG: thioredoxin family protein [Armatimonadota bacterium]
MILMLVLAMVTVAMSGCPKPAPQAEPPTVTTPTAQTEDGAQTATEAGTEAGKSITWMTSLDEAMAAAKQENKPVIVDFWATWCGPCVTMEEATWPDPKVVAASANYIMVKQDVDKNQQTAGKYKVEGVPTLLFLSPEGKETHRQVGAISAAELTELMSTQQTPAP